MKLTAERTIDAPVDVVFKTLADIREYSKAVPHVIKYEFLTEATSGVGTRYRETREMNGREVVNDLEITEYVENDRVRIVADANGTIWDTIFSVAPSDGKTMVKILTEARAYKLLPRLINPLIKGMVAKAGAKDMELVKAYCENNRE